MTLKLPGRTRFNTRLGCWCLCLFACAPNLGCVYLNGNFRTVEDGVLYRSGQLSPVGLERRLEKHSIRTVVSLRGPDDTETWYRDEIAVCAEAGAEHVDVPWSMKTLPTPESLLRLIRIYEEGGGPILVHCQGGTHRAGVASAVYVLIHGGDATAAREQFHRGFDDAPIGQLIDLYESSEKPFVEWARDDYPRIYETLSRSKG